MSYTKQALIVGLLVVSIVLLLMSLISQFDAFDWLAEEWSTRGVWYLTAGIIILAVDIAVFMYLRRRSD